MRKTQKMTGMRITRGMRTIRTNDEEDAMDEKYVNDEDDENDYIDFEWCKR